MSAAEKQRTLPGTERKHELDREPGAVTCEREKSERADLWRAVLLARLTGDPFSGDPVRTTSDATTAADLAVRSFCERYQQTAASELLPGGDPFK